MYSPFKEKPLGFLLLSSHKQLAASSERRKKKMKPKRTRPEKRD
jgi:hypothetical protein